jgi:hypothetical protein
MITRHPGHKAGVLVVLLAGVIADGMVGVRARLSLMAVVGRMGCGGRKVVWEKKWTW